MTRAPGRRVRARAEHAQAIVKPEIPKVPAVPKVPKIPKIPKIPAASGGGHLASKVGGGAVAGGVVAGGLLEHYALGSQGYANLSKAAGARGKVLLADLRPAKSALVRSRGSVTNPVKNDLNKLKSQLGQAKSVAKQAAAPVGSQLSKDKAAVKNELATAKSALHAQVTKTVKPVKSALVKSPALKQAQAARNQLKGLGAEAKGELSKAKSSVQKVALPATSQLAKDKAKLSQGKAGLGSALKSVYGQDRTKALSSMKPAKSALVRDKSALKRALAPVGSSASSDLGTAKKLLGQAAKNASAEKAKLGQGAVGQVKKRPKIWNILKPVGSP
jgi:hypothetical protein